MHLCNPRQLQLHALPDVSFQPLSSISRQEFLEPFPQVEASAEPPTTESSERRPSWRETSDSLCKLNLRIARARVRIRRPDASRTVPAASHAHTHLRVRKPRAAAVQPLVATSAGKPQPWGPGPRAASGKGSTRPGAAGRSAPGRVRAEPERAGELGGRGHL